MTTHRVKCWPGFFDAIADGSKPFTLRRADRDYKVGDTLVLCEWLPANGNGRYTGREVSRRISYVLDGAETGWHDAELPRAGLRAGYSILGFGEIDEKDAAREA